MENLERFIDEKIWITKGARFNAYRRYRAKNTLSVTAISLLSVYLICLGLYPLYQPVSDTNSLSYISVAISILLLVISLLEAGKDYSVKSNQHHECGKKLNELQSTFMVFRTETDSSLRINNFQEVLAAYHRVLAECPENHAPIDEEFFRLQKGDSSINPLLGFRIWFQAKIGHLWLYLIMIFSPLILAWLVLI